MKAPKTTPLRMPTIVSIKVAKITGADFLTCDGSWSVYALSRGAIADWFEILNTAGTGELSRKDEERTRATLRHGLELLLGCERLAGNARA